jgi:crotonobetainyl-CoA:carnitine CoA-transferase CaiB-like acyl-CoA transferase
VRSGVSFIDLSTGTLCAFGIVNALLQRQQTGRGQRVDGALLDTAIAMLNYHVESCLLTGVVPRRMGSALPALAPYRNFRCADDHWVFVAGANDGLVRKLMKALGLDAVCDDPRFATNAARCQNREEIDRIVAEAIGRHDRDSLLRIFDEADFPCSPVNAVDESLNDPQLQARQMMWQMDHPDLGQVPVVRFPVPFSEMKPALRRHSPRLGEHTAEVLAELGMSAAEIDALRAKEAIK